MSTKRLISTLFQGLILIVIVFFMGRYVIQQLRILDLSDLSVNPLLLILGQLGITLGLSGIPFGSWLLAKQFGGHDLKPKEIWHAFFVGLVAKYVPGGIWSVTSRTVLYKQYGLTTANSIEVAFWEVSLSVIGAILMTLPGITLLSGSSYMVPVMLLFGAFIVGFFLVIGLWNTPLMEKARGFLPPQVPIVGSAKDITLQLPLKVIITTTLFYVGIWVIIGLGFAAIVYAFAPDLPLSTIPQIIGLYAGGWTVGFLVFFVPGGLGVRDALLLFGLSSLAPTPIPLMASVVVRLMWTAVEVFGLLITTLIARSKNQE